MTPRLTDAAIFLQRGRARRRAHHHALDLLLRSLARQAGSLASSTRCLHSAPAPSSCTAPVT